MSGAALLLRARLWLRARGPVACIGGALLVAAVVALAWLLPLASRQNAQRAQALAAALAPKPVAPVPVKAASIASPDANLAAFNDVLGERRYVEQQVGTLFALAAKNGLSLSQGEYKSAVEKNGGFATYQVSLPVKGSYGAIWQFATAALGAIPFASLDDISFRRDSIGQAGVEARLRLTLYLKEAP